jgi:hypothetical protein
VDDDRLAVLLRPFLGQQPIDVEALPAPEKEGGSEPE